MGYFTEKLLEYSENVPKRCGFECCFYIANLTHCDSVEFSGNTSKPHCGIDGGKPVVGERCRLEAHQFTSRLLEYI